MSPARVLVGSSENVQINFGGREVTIKLVYYGPALSGKTSNLRALHELTNQASRGRLMTLETKDDRTLFFDMLPFVLKTEAASAGGQGMSIRIKIFTVPGQVLHASTRRLVLQGADGIAFIADSQRSETEHNAASFLDLRQNLVELGFSLKELPIVIQYNKRDLQDVRSDDEIEVLAKRGREPVFKASAVHGRGVLETFVGLAYATWNRLDQEHQLAKMLNFSSSGFLPMVVKQLGLKQDPATLLASCVGGTFERRSQVSS
jgi:signal recognition particle receptor subunit beta